jgi:hypothetical protein
MSFFADSLALRRKRTATERAESNGDPLVAKKKAREAAKVNAATPAFTATVAKAAPVPKKTSNVSSYY